MESAGAWDLHGRTHSYLFHSDSMRKPYETKAIYPSWKLPNSSDRSVPRDAHLQLVQACLHRCKRGMQVEPVQGLLPHVNSGTCTVISLSRQWDLVRGARDALKIDTSCWITCSLAFARLTNSAVVQ